MKKIFTIAWKDAIIRFSSASELLFFIILPVIFTVLLGGGTSGGGGESRIRLLVVDEAQTSISEQIIQELEDSTAVYPVVTDREDAQKQFDARNASTIFIIPAGVDADSLQNGATEVELKKQPNNINATVVERAVLTAIRRVSSSVSAAQNSVTQRAARQPFASNTEKQAYFDSSLELAQDIQESTPERVIVNKGATPDQVEYDPRANSSAGQLITWVFIPLFGISAMFAYERQQGTLRRVLTTPTRKATYLFGTISGQVLIALAQMTILVLFGIFVMKLAWGDEPLALFAVLLTAALSAAAFGTTLGTFVKTENQASGLSIMFGMVFALMGGCWYPWSCSRPLSRSIVEDPAHHLGDAGIAGHRPARARAVGDPARGGGPADLCRRFLCDRGLAFSL